MSHKVESIFVRAEVLCNIRLRPKIQSSSKFIFQVGCYVVIREGIFKLRVLSVWPLGRDGVVPLALRHSKQTGNSSGL